MPRVESIAVHPAVVTFAVLVSAAVVLLASLVPGGVAAGVATPTVHAMRRITPGTRARTLLVITQIAITVMLLFGASLFVRSFSAVLRVHPGFATEGVLTMHVAVTRAKYRQDARVAANYERILGRVGRIPVVVAAGIVNRLPLAGIAQTGGVEFEGREGSYDSDWRSATPGYFDAIGIPLKAGRLFTEFDSVQSPLIGLIDERLAQQVLGQRVRLADGSAAICLVSQQDPWAEIVGVVGHILNDNLERDSAPAGVLAGEPANPGSRRLVIRTAGPPDAYAHAVIEQIRSEDPDQPVYDVRSMREWVGRTLQTRTPLTGLVTLFGGASLVLACLGLYGMVAYSATMRLREFGVRLALGGNAAHIRRLILVQAGTLALIGSAVGLTRSWPVGRAVEGLLFGVSKGDVVSWTFAPAIVIAGRVAVRSWSRRTRREDDPAITLRAE
jgi:predicted permease